MKIEYCWCARMFETFFYLRITTSRNWGQHLGWYKEKSHEAFLQDATLNFFLFLIPFSHPFLWFLCQYTQYTSFRRCSQGCTTSIFFSSSFHHIYFVPRICQYIWSSSMIKWNSKFILHWNLAIPIYYIWNIKIASHSEKFIFD